MSRATNNKSTSPRKSGSPMLMGILLGMIAGVALAAGLAWYLLKSPSPFVNKEQVVKPSADIVKPSVEVAKHAVDVARPGADSAADSGEEAAKPRFEFYKVLTDKQDAAADTQPRTPEAQVVNKPPASFKETYLQAGAFANADDAENFKATLAMKGLEAHVHTVAIPGKGEMHRVRLGPFKSEQ
ncbi:MAG: SPOR domain-containing protein [Gallionella sp.]|nr:SPOR domain-containing protein [Gallionella sp.]